MSSRTIIKWFSLDLKQNVKFSLNTLHKNTARMLAGNGVRLSIQAVYFVLMARSLGAEQYGTFVAVVAAAAVASPFVGNGFGSLMIKHVAHDRSQFSESFGNLLSVTLASGLVLFAILLPVCIVVLPRVIAPAVIIMILVSDLLVFPYLGVAGVAFWSLERLGWTATLNATGSLARLAGIVVIILLHRPTLMAWSVAYLSASTLSSTIALGCALWFLGMPKMGLRRIKGEMWEGLCFSGSLSAQNIYNNIDKTMLARLGTLEAAGIYAAAYRLIDVAFLPVASLLSAAYPGFFREGKGGVQAAAKYGRRLLKQVLPYSLLASAAAFVGAPLVPWILGHQYAEVTDALRWLALLPLLKTVHYFLADSLTGAGYQGRRTLVQIGIAVFNILINLWIIPVYGWRGAAWASLGSDGMFAVCMFVALSYLGRREELSSAPCGAEPRVAS